MPMKKDRIREALNKKVIHENNETPNIIRETEKHKESIQTKHENIKQNNKETMHLTAVLLSDRAYEKLLQIALERPARKMNAGLPSLLKEIIERMLQEFPDLDAIEPANEHRHRRINVYISGEAKERFRFMRLAKKRSMSELIDSYIINYL